MVTYETCCTTTCRMPMVCAAWRQVFCHLWSKINAQSCRSFNVRALLHHLFTSYWRGWLPKYTRQLFCDWWGRFWQPLLCQHSADFLTAGAFHVFFSFTKCEGKFLNTLGVTPAFSFLHRRSFVEDLGATKSFSSKCSPHTRIHNFIHGEGNSFIAANRMQPFLS